MKVRVVDWKALIFAFSVEAMCLKKRVSLLLYGYICSAYHESRERYGLNRSNKTNYLKLSKQAAEITFVNGGKRERSRPRNEVTNF